MMFLDEYLYKGTKNSFKEGDEFSLILYKGHSLDCAMSVLKGINACIANRTKQDLSFPIFGSELKLSNPHSNYISNYYEESHTYQYFVILEGVLK